MSAVCNRRRFLAATVEAVAGVTLTGWNSTVRAAPGQPAAGTGGLTVIDTHTHFYDPTRSQGVPWPPREDKLLYRPVLDAMRVMFGSERLMYASNWPVCERFAPLATVQGIVAGYFRSYGRRAEENVFSQTAKAAYRWGRREK